MVAPVVPRQPAVLTHAGRVVTMYYTLVISWFTGVFWMTQLRFPFLILFVLVMSVGCASGDGGRYGSAASQQSIAVLGVVSRADSKARVYPATLSRELVARIRERARKPVLTMVQVQGATPHALRQQVLMSYQKNGAPDAELLQQVAAALPGVRYLVLAAIEDLSTKRAPPQYQAFVDGNGSVQPDRYTVTLMHQRNVRVSAVSIDLASGRVVRNQMVTATPVSSRQHTRYQGSSIAGSIATSLTNTLSSGPNASRYPPPPAAGPSILNLFPAIADALF